MLQRYLIILASFFFFVPVPAYAASLENVCSALAGVPFDGAQVTAMTDVEEGTFSPPGGQVPFDMPAMRPGGDANAAPNPAFCRVEATLKPTPESNIGVEVWLPRHGWNGKFLAVGSFGWGGRFMYVEMLSGLRHGYAVANTDTGHKESEGGTAAHGGSFALGHPEQLNDYAYRANHLMIEYAKTLITARYGKAPEHSYWVGCSLGGLEGLIEAKRYPNDLDGIVVGAPPNPITNFNALQLWPGWFIAQDPERLIPESKYKMVHEAVLKQCASPIGQSQGFVDDPEKCVFDPATLLCKDGDAADCLTPKQLDLLKQTYAGPVNRLTGASIFPGPAYGSETDMYMMANGKPFNVAQDMFSYVAFENPQWQTSDMQWGKDFEAASAKIGPLLHVDSDLTQFFNRGGKLLLYIGWNDYHNPKELVGYYDSLINNSGATAKDQVRLFALPGMNHCMGGAGCDTFDKLAAIDTWIVDGKAPTELISSKYDVEGNLIRTRPICAYPMKAYYLGTGAPEDASSYACVQ